MKQRGNFSITTLILLAIQQKPLTKTRLMQELTLSYKRVGWYCNTLVHEGLVEYNPANHTYAITPQGAEVLKLYEELANLLTPVDRMIKKYSFCIQDQYPQEYRDTDLGASSREKAKPALSSI